MTTLDTSRRSSAPARDIDGPRPIDHLNEIAGELARGRWVVLAHEWLPDGMTLDEWEDAVRATCQAKRLLAATSTFLQEGVTIVMNAAAMPTLVQLEDSVVAIHRFQRSPKPLH